MKNTTRHDDRQTSDDSGGTGDTSDGSALAFGARGLARRERPLKTYVTMQARRVRVEDEFRGVMRINRREAETLLIKLQRLLHEGRG